MGSANFTAPFQLLQPVNVDPTKYATEYANLAALAQTRQLRQQEMANQQAEMQVRQADFEQKQQAMDQMRAVNQAYTDAFKPDQNGAMQLDRDAFTAALLKGGHGNAIPAIHKDWEEQDKATAALQEQNTKTAQAHADYAGTIGQLLKTGNYDPHLALTVIQNGAHKGIIDDTQGQQLVDQITSRLAQDPTGESARAWIQPIADQMIQSSPTQQALAKTQQEIQASKATAGEAAARTTETEQKTTAAQRSDALQQLSAVTSQDQYDALRAQYPKVTGNWPPVYSPAAVTQLSRMAVPVEKQPEFDLQTSQAKALKAMVDEKPENLDALVDQIVPPNDPMNASTKVLMRRSAAFGDAKGVQKVLQDAYDQRGRIQTAKETAANKIQLDLGGLTGSAGQPSSMAQAVANYQIPLSSAVGRGGPAARQALMGQVLAANPNFQEQYYQTFQKTENDATTGKTATSANALNTMMGHLEVLDKAADALKNNDVQALNRMANFLGAQTGNSAQTVYDTIVHRLGPEVTKAYVAGGGSSGERGTNEQDFSRNLGPDQIKQNIGVSALLADSKIKALQDQYARGTYGRGQQKLISDEAEAARQRLAGRAAGLAPGGQSYQHTATGPNGHKIGSNDGKTWFDLQTGQKVQ